MAEGGASKRMWGGRFEGSPGRALQEYTSSLPVDSRLYKQDIAGSIAHVHMLGAQKIIPAADAQALSKGLNTVRKEIDTGAFRFLPSDEDIHSAVERRLHELLGPEVAGKLHTARSRNDQVALDLRLYAREAIGDIGRAICRLQSVLLNLAQSHQATLLPAYTHLQRAQPTTLAHHLLAYVAMLQRDFDRVQDAYDRADIMPLGAGAVTATSLPIKREMVAAELGFGAISQNSMDAVSDRDFVVEIEAALALVMVHLSRLAEEIVLWATSEFDFVELPDEYATGSSLMPQKKNPDVAELVRGRTGGVFGALQAMLTTLKGLPLSYNRDLQEDKEGFFRAVDTALQSLDIMARMLSRVRFEVASMERAASDPALLATELAEYLVRKDVPFREAHEVVGRAVKRAASKKLAISSLTGEQWRSLHPAFGDDVEKLFDAHQAVTRREVPGSPGPRAIKRALLRGVLAVKRNQEWLKENTTA